MGELKAAYDYSRSHCNARVLQAFGWSHGLRAFKSLQLVKNLPICRGWLEELAGVTLERHKPLARF